MAEVSGTVRDYRIEQEGADVVLRFVLETEGDAFPCEARGRRVRGLIENGDKIALVARGATLRDRFGIVRPSKIENLTTSSLVRVEGERTRSAFGLFGKASFSLFVGFVTSSVVSLLVNQSDEDDAPSPFSGQGGSSSIDIWEFLALGLLLSLAVSLLAYHVWPRLHR